MVLIQILSFLITTTTALPLNWIQKAAETEQFEKFENYLPKIGDIPKYHYSTYPKTQNLVLKPEEIEFKSWPGKNNTPKTLGGVMDFIKEGALAGMDLIMDVKDILAPEATITGTVKNETQNKTEISKDIQLDPITLKEDSNNTSTNRTVREKEKEVVEEDDIEFSNVDKPKNGNKTSEKQEEEDEEEPNMITGLISAFLGGLSRPDGSVDIEAITGLLGGLSAENPDGTYNFNGLTDLLMSFFGGGGEEGGGSDFGAFLGGIAGAFIKGVANPPGAKGSGIFVGNLLTGVLPALSAPAPTEEVDGQKPSTQSGLDIKGFLSGLLSTIFGTNGLFATILGSSSGSSSGSGGHEHDGGGGSKFSLFKAIFSTITSVLTSSSSSG